MLSEAFKKYDDWLTNVPEEALVADYTYFSSAHAVEYLHELLKVSKEGKKIDKDVLVGMVMDLLNCLDCDTYEKLKNQMY